MPRISFTGGEGGGFTPIPKGTYGFVIDKVEERQSSNNNPQIMVHCHVEDGSQYDGHKLVDFFTLTEKSGWKLRAFVQAVIPDKIELTETGEEDKANVDFDTDDLIGERFMADVVIKKDQNGNDRNELSNYRPYPVEGEEEPAQDDEEPAAEAQGEEEPAQDDEEPAAEAAPPQTQTRTASRPAQTTQAKPAATQQRQAPAAQAKPAQKAAPAQAARPAAPPARERRRLG